MILNNSLKIPITFRNKTHYKNLGYDVNKKKEIVVFSDDILKHLSKSSGVICDVKCDKCGKEYNLSFSSYFKNLNRGGYFSCKQCSNDKKKVTNLIIFGVDNYAKLENYGDIVKKIKKEKFGDENYNNKEQHKITCLEKFGKNYFMETDDFKEFRLKRNESFNNNLIKKLKKFGVVDVDCGIYKIKCDKDHIFEINPFIFRNRLKQKTILCTICNPVGSYYNSGYEIQLQEFIKENYIGNIILNDRKMIKPKELDVYLPDLKIAFEFNGLFHHNEVTKYNNYHLNKTEMCEQQGIHLIHIYDDDWIYKQKIVKSRILNLLGKTENKIYGRKCIIKEITDNKLIRNFLNENHIQSFIGGQVKIGLFYNDELVSLMTFGKQRKSMGIKSEKNVYEMLRFCNKLNTNIIGSASKLFKYFIEKYKPVEVISYADRSWSRGELYYKLGFQLIHKTPPNYYYVIDGIRKHRFNFRKDKLIRDGFDPNKTEHEIMLERKIYRIYDSGNLKMKFKNEYI